MEGARVKLTSQWAEQNTSLQLSIKEVRRVQLKKACWSGMLGNVGPSTSWCLHCIKMTKNKDISVSTALIWTILLIICLSWVQQLYGGTIQNYWSISLRNNNLKKAESLNSPFNQVKLHHCWKAIVELWYSWFSISTVNQK